MPKFIDLTGRKFGRLTVLGRAPNRSNHTAWNCRCDCGNEKEIAGSSLKSGITVSCGCYNREISSNRNKTNFSHTNEYEFTVDTCIGYTSKGEMFLVDIDKYDLIKDFSWYISSDGYVLSNDNSGDKQKHIFLHRLITGCPVGMVVDHINGAERRFDNRLCNLRICTSYNRCNSRWCRIYKSMGIELEQGFLCFLVCTAQADAREARLRYACHRSRYDHVHRHRRGDRGRYLRRYHRRHGPRGHRYRAGRRRYV